MTLKIAIGQLQTETGHPNHNFNEMKKMIEQAKADGADIIAFPEMCVGGYFLADKWTDEEYMVELESFNEKIKAESDNIGIVWGNVSTDENIICGRDGRKVRFNTAFFAYNRQYVEHSPYQGRHVKVLQPDYRVFDDTRYFLSGVELALRLNKNVEEMIEPFLFEKDGVVHRIGLEVCEDMWSKDYAVDPTAILLQKGAEAIISISASPWNFTKETSRHKRIKEHVKNNGKIVPFYYVNVCGMQNNGKNILMFDGMSTVYDENGEIVSELRDDFTNDYALIDLQKPFCRTVNHKLMNCLVRAIQEFDHQIMGYGPKWIIGLSGGLDSSVNAALLTMALGAERICGYNLATRYNSAATKNNAAKEAEALGIQIRNGYISEVYQSTVDTTKLYGYTDEQMGSLVHENIQARVRGHMLSTFAQIENGVIMNNGNKIEIAVGYATLYGDTIGAMSPLGDLTKVQLFALAHDINEHFGKEVVPESLLPTIKDDRIIWDMAPSAELKDAQVDPMKWYYHDWLIDKLTIYPGYHVEDIMQSYLDGSLQESETGKWLRYYGLDDPAAFIKDLEWVLRQMRISIFKRIQMPPIVMISRGSFGYDYREVQGSYEPTERYNQLKQQILAMKQE